MLNVRIGKRIMQSQVWNISRDRLEVESELEEDQLGPFTERINPLGMVVKQIEAM